ncbi:twitching motility protein PilT [Polynucleobacter wuianus]|uniref:Twitching motility protein PilT n=1 Tax=Polynucleobacter wuianus TaxID=1743168 RepID=A0A191UG27_9BURK|nr:MULTISPECIES: PIN domain-containing protein [Polynucleobacter]ANI99856.1 twitching motility protein PilT [Polynucleobacter wuianus]MBU3552679.1 PIN domain-containing protein [Polynucleobacter sp. MWH-Post4-6-1]MBU3610582.1 PIN domain-containing protein [Polynucleobacter wuianus]
MTMILADTSVWVAHFRKSNPLFISLLTNDRILCHPLVLIELACGSPPSPRLRTISDVKRLQQATVATTEETLQFIEAHKLYESGCGAIDVSLLASTLLSENALIWTFDKHLESLASLLGISYNQQLH